MANAKAMDVNTSPQMEKGFAPQADGTYAEVVTTSGGGVTDSAGTLIFPQAMSHVYGYDGSNNLTTDTATDGTNTWVRTYTYSGTTITAASRWVKQ